MGLTIQAKKSPKKSIDMGGGGFLCLRTKVAELAGEPWASHYRQLVDVPFSGQTPKFFEAFDQRTVELLEQKKVPIKLVDFCLQSDVAGAVHYGACKQLLKIIGDYDDNIRYGYGGRPDCAMFRDFKDILRECAEKKCDMVWS